MDAYPRIPVSQSAAARARAPAASLPPVGTVVMASVEEDLGEGMYALRWAGNRISVTSRAILTPGQSLILKSEISPEGRATLVVQGPALPDSDVSSHPHTYSPPRHASVANQGGGGGAGAGLAAGGEVAAGVSRDTAPEPLRPTASLLGAILEPLPHFQATAAALLRQAEDEMKLWAEHRDAFAENGNWNGRRSDETSVSEKAVNDGKLSDFALREVSGRSERFGTDSPRAETTPGETPDGRETGEVRKQEPAEAARSDGARPAHGNAPPEPANREAVVAVHPVRTEEVATAPFEGSRSAPETPPENAARPAAAPETSDAPPPLRPETFLKEALAQLVKAADLPLANSPVDTRALGVGSKVPEAIADKAATILLRAAGLTPDAAVVDAAKALIENNVPIDRATIQAMLVLASEIADGDRGTVFHAAARQVARDIPLAAPLAGGLADVMDRKAGVYELIGKLSETLAAGPDTPETRPLMDAARELVELLHVDLERGDAAFALERYVSTFGRETLGRALALVEASAQAVIENNGELGKIDRAMTEVLKLLEREIAAPAARSGDQPPAPLPAAPRPGETENRPALDSDRPAPAAEQAEGEPEGRPVQPDARFPIPHPGVEAYPRPPGPFPAMENPIPPPVPKGAVLPEDAGKAGEQTVQTVGTAPAAPGIILRPEEAPGPQSVPVAPVPPPVYDGQPGVSVKISQDASPVYPSLSDGERPLAFPEGFDDVPTTEQRERRDNVLAKLDSLFQLPGVNRPEVELLRPAGALERFLNAAGGETARSADVVRDLLSDDPEKVERAIRELPKKDAAVLRETASRLARMEHELIRREPLLTRLAEAAGTLRDLGRQLLAVKAENLAGQERNPPVMLAEVPFRLADNGGGGRMQMFYRKGKGGKEGWSSRVILDLDTTSLGPVLGDMRFFGSDMILNLFVEKRDAADFLEKSAEELSGLLLGKGFRVKSRFMVLPPPKTPEIHAERPEMREEPMAENRLPVSGTRRAGRLDTKA